MSAVVELQEFTNYAVRCLCDKPDEVTVSVSDSTGTVVLLVVDCARSDLSLLIGSGGRNVNSLRQLLTAIAAKHKTRAVLVLKE